MTAPSLCRSSWNILELSSLLTVIQTYCGLKNIISIVTGPVWWHSAFQIQNCHRLEHLVIGTMYLVFGILNQYLLVEKIGQNHLNWTLSIWSVLILRFADILLIRTQTAKPRIQILFFFKMKICRGEKNSLFPAWNCEDILEKRALSKLTSLNN